MACSSEVHVSDIGTIYRVRALDNDVDFDFSSASVMELIFRMPTGAILRKTATVGVDGSPATKWYLEYTVQPGDGVGSPGEFHDNEGPFQVQGYLEWADGTHWHSNIQTVDTDGNELRIFPNLD